MKKLIQMKKMVYMKKLIEIKKLVPLQRVRKAAEQVHTESVLILCFTPLMLLLTQPHYLCQIFRVSFVFYHCFVSHHFLKLKRVL